MTHIETDNPLLQFRIWCYDIIWQYWYIWLVVLVVAVWLISRYFAKRQRELDEYMLNERKKHENNTELPTYAPHGTIWPYNGRQYIRIDDTWIEMGDHLKYYETEKDNFKE